MIKSLDTARGTIVIREADMADAEKFRQLRLFALQDSPTAFSADYQINLNHPMTFWEGRLKPVSHGTIFVAESDSRLIAMMGIRMGESPKTKHGAGIWGVFVCPEWRGLHIAKETIEMCCGWAKVREVQIVRLAVVSTNESAIRLYERSGFSIYGTEPHALYFEGQYFDELLMFKALT